jgi:CRISPR system Cascade subunit CasD
MEACWPARLGLSGQAREVALYDRRDWRNQVHAGRRQRIEGLIEEDAP